MEYYTETEVALAKNRLLQEMNRDKTNLLKGSIEQQQMAKKIVDLELQVRDLRNLVEPLVQEFECAFDNDEKCTSPEIAEDYIKIASHLRDKYGRTKGHRIDDVQKWIDNYLPY